MTFHVEQRGVAMKIQMLIAAIIAVVGIVWTASELKSSGGGYGVAALPVFVALIGALWWIVVWVIRWLKRP
jgi:hypothetical protein